MNVRPGLVASVLVLTATMLAGAPRAALGARQQSEIPSVINDDQGRTLWVSAEHVAAQGPGFLRQLHDPERFSVEWLRNPANQNPLHRPANRLPGDSCIDYLGALGSPTQSHDFDELARTVSNIFVGTVVASSDGLFAGSPQTMLLVAVDRWLKRNDETPESSVAYMRYYSPRVEIAGVAACRLGEGLPPAPPVGATVLAMTYFGPSHFVDEAPSFYAGNMLVYDGFEEGRPVLMASDLILRDSPEWMVDATVASLEDRIAQMLASPDAFSEVRDRGAPPAQGSSIPDSVDVVDVPAREADPPGECLFTGACLQTPLVLGFGIFRPLTSSFRESNTLFDIDGDGRVERTAWVSLFGYMGDAFLWMDLNGNQRVDGAHEFFGAPGTDPRDDAPRVDSALEVLAVFDDPRYGGNDDGKINESDRVWERLLLWNDLNEDGISEEAEVSPVSARVVSFDLGYEIVDQGEGSLNRVLARGHFWIRGPRRDLRVRTVWEYRLRFR